MDGLTLVAGRSIAFNFIFEFEDGTRAVLTPHHTMYAVRLVKPPDAPDHPILRTPKLTSETVPLVQVYGIRPLSKVRVVDALDSGRRTLGVRIGTGSVHLVSLDADGTFELQAEVGDSASNTVKMNVDRTAAPPKLTVKGSKLTAECEPQAECELWWGIDGSPVALLDGGRADDKGLVDLVLGDKELTGWTVTGFDGSRFERPVFVESWPKIDKFFQGGSADERLPADAFSYRCQGLLKVETPGTYTFELNTDDGSRLYIDGEVVLDHWGHHGMSAHQHRPARPRAARPADRLLRGGRLGRLQVPLRTARRRTYVRGARAPGAAADRGARVLRCADRSARQSLRVQYGREGGRLTLQR